MLDDLDNILKELGIESASSRQLSKAQAQVMSWFKNDVVLKKERKTAASIF